MKEFAVLRRTAVFELAIGRDQIEGLANVLEQAVFMAAGFHAKAHDEAADGQIIQFRHHRQDPAASDQRPRHLAHAGQRLHTHNPPLLIDIQNVVHADADIAPRQLVLWHHLAHGLPAGTGGAELFPGTVAFPVLDLPDHVPHPQFMPGWRGSQPEENMVADINIQAIGAGNGQEEHGREQAAMMGQNVFK